MSSCKDEGWAHPTFELPRRLFSSRRAELPSSGPAPPLVALRVGLRGGGRAELPSSGPAPPLSRARKIPPTPRRTTPSTRLYIPPPPAKRENPQPTPPAHWALPRLHRSPAKSRRAAGPRRPAPQEAGTPPMITAAHSGGRRRCLCFQHPHDTAFRSDRQGVRSFGRGSCREVSGDGLGFLALPGPGAAGPGQQGREAPSA